MQGIQIFDAAGTVTMDTSKQTWGFLGSFVTTTAGGSMNFPQAYGLQQVVAQQHMIGVLPTDQQSNVHTLTISAITSTGSTVTASGGNAATNIVVLGR